MYSNSQDGYIAFVVPNFSLFYNSLFFYFIIFLLVSVLGQSVIIFPDVRC